MTCRLEVVCGRTSLGQSVGVVGACQELGLWEPSLACRLQTGAETFPVWTAEVPQAVLGTEFKLVILGPEDAVEWETLDNRRWPPAEADRADERGAVLSTSFNDPCLQVRTSPSVSSGRPGESAARAVGRPRCKFEPTVSCHEVPSLKELDVETKRAMWWRSSDFSANINARVGMVQKYYDALRQGTAASLAEAVCQAAACCGLDLEREARPNAIKVYVEAVLREQEIQRRVGRLVRERIAMVAQAASQRDLEYSISDAAKDAEEARRYVQEASEEAVILKDEGRA